MWDVIPDYKFSHPFHLNLEVAWWKLELHVLLDIHWLQSHLHCMIQFFKNLFLTHKDTMTQRSKRLGRTTH